MTWEPLVLLVFVAFVNQTASHWSFSLHLPYVLLILNMSPHGFPLCFFLLFLMSQACVHAKSLQLSPTLCNPINCNPPDSCVQGILEARILEWVAISSSGGSSQFSSPVSPASPASAGRFFTSSATWEALTPNTPVREPLHLLVKRLRERGVAGESNEMKR